jgi:hypothetical protein
LPDLEYGILPPGGLIWRANLSGRPEPSKSLSIAEVNIVIAQKAAEVALAATALAALAADALLRLQLSALPLVTVRPSVAFPLNGFTDLGTKGSGFLYSSNPFLNSDLSVKSAVTEVVISTSSPSLIVTEKTSGKHEVKVELTVDLISTLANVNKGQVKLPGSSDSLNKVTVESSSVQTTSVITVTPSLGKGTAIITSLGMLYVGDIEPGVSFSIFSSNFLDKSIINWVEYL